MAKDTEKFPFIATRPPVGRVLLEGFLQLDTPEADAIQQRYARKYGPLYLCARHQWPLSHEVPRRPPFAKPAGPSDGLSGSEVADEVERAATELEALAEAYGTPGLRYEQCVGPIDLELVPGRVRAFREPIAVWGQYARQARAILALAAGLHRDEIGTLEQWRIALGAATNEELPWSWSSDAERRHVINSYRATDWHFQWLKLLGIIQDWLRRSNVQLTATLRKETDSTGRWVVTPYPKIGSPYGLFGNLAMQLLFAACRATGWVSCANTGTGAQGCHGIYFPKRQPSLGQPHWCPRCRGREHSRIWYQRRGRKMRTKRRRSEVKISPREDAGSRVQRFEGKPGKVRARRRST